MAGSVGGFRVSSEPRPSAGRRWARTLRPLRWPDCPGPVSALRAESGFAARLGVGRGRPVVLPAPHPACLCVCAPSPGPPELLRVASRGGSLARPATSRPFHGASLRSFLALPSSRLCCGHRTCSPPGCWTRPAHSRLSSWGSFVLLLWGIFGYCL